MPTSVVDPDPGGKKASVSDPYSLNPDPDPAKISIRIQKTPESGSKLFPNTF